MRPSACSLYNAALILYHSRAGMSIIFFCVRGSSISFAANTAGFLVKRGIQPPAELVSMPR